MDHESDTDSDEEHILPNSTQHDHYAHQAHLHRDFRNHCPPLYLPLPKKKKVNSYRPNESMKERVHRVQSRFTAAQLLCLRMEFNAFDVDSSNTIDTAELRAIVDSLGGHHIHTNELHKLMNTIDEDASGEVDWVEYMDMMLALRDGYADKSVADFLTRHPIILLVLPEKNAATYVRKMLYASAKEAKIDIHVVQAYTAQGALRFMKKLPPGRKVSLMLSAFEMYPHTGRKMLRYMKRNLFFTPPCYFLTNFHLTTKIHKPEGCEKVLLMMDLEPHMMMLMVIRHCGSKKRKNENMQSAHQRALTHAHTDVRHENDQVHRIKHHLRIGNKGVAFKPSRPRDKTNFAFATSSRWEGAFDNVSPRVFHEVLSKAGGESPRMIPISPRGMSGSIHAMPSVIVDEKQKRLNNNRLRFDLSSHLEEMSMSRILPVTLKSPRPTISDLRRVTPRRSVVDVSDVGDVDVPVRGFTPRRR